MTDVPPSNPPRCLRPDGGCSWSHHNYKHFPAKGTTKEHTRHGPAKYLPELVAIAIQALETDTTASATDVQRDPGSGQAQYARNLRSVIGWDEGRDATFSYVECSGGTRGGRSFHGRPMHGGNAGLARFTAGGSP